MLYFTFVRSSALDFCVVLVPIGLCACNHELCICALDFRVVLVLLCEMWHCYGGIVWAWKRYIGYSIILKVLHADVPAVY
jgi:hypothetical protein